MNKYTKCLQKYKYGAIYFLRTALCPPFNIAILSLILITAEGKFVQLPVLCSRVLSFPINDSCFL